jgi:cytochrome oxidase assembly protein ShyY1
MVPITPDRTGVGTATVPHDMYRFLLRPRWLAFHLLVMAAIVAMVNLGFWQLRRLDERQAFNERVRERIDIAPVPLEDVLAAASDPAAVEWRAVEATGTYLGDEQVAIVNRSQGGRAGQHVATPLELANGRLLIVDRGFVPLGDDVPAPPPGEVTVVGRVHPSQERRRGQLSDPEGERAEFQRVDLDRLAEQLPAPVVPMYVDLVSSEPPQGSSPAPTELPELSEGPHLSYAVQWYIFAGCVAVGWVLAVRHSVRTRRQPASRDGDDPAFVSVEPAHFDGDRGIKR